MSGVNGSKRIVRQHAVFYGKDRYRCLRVFDEQRIVSHTETEENIELSFGVIEQLCLAYGVAYRFELAGMNLLFVFDAQVFFRNRPRLAHD